MCVAFEIEQTLQSKHKNVLQVLGYILGGGNVQKISQFASHSAQRDLMPHDDLPFIRLAT